MPINNEILKLIVQVDDSEVEALERKLDSVEDEQVDVTVQSDDSEIKDLERRLDSIDDETVNIEVEADDSALDGLLGKLQDLAGPAGAAAALGGLAAIATSAFEAADEIDSLSTSSGLSVENLQIMGRIAIDSGGSIEDVADAAREMQLRLAEATTLGSGPAIDALKLLNIELSDFSNLNVDDKFALLRDRISEVTDPAKKLFIQEELLGGSTERLNVLLGLNTDAYNTRAAAIAENEILTSDQVRNANDANDALEQLTTQLTVLTQEFAIELAPTVIDSIDSFNTLTDGGKALAASIRNIIDPTKGIREQFESWLGETNDVSESVEGLSDKVNAIRPLIQSYGGNVYIAKEETINFDNAVTGLSSNLSGLHNRIAENVGSLREYLEILSGIDRYETQLSGSGGVFGALQAHFRGTREVNRENDTSSDRRASSNPGEWPEGVQ